MLERIVERHSDAVIDQMPLARPEINPLAPHPAAAFAAYESSLERPPRATRTRIHLCNLTTRDKLGRNIASASLWRSRRSSRSSASSWSPCSRIPAASATCSNRPHRGGKKLVLLGRNKNNGQRVVIKASSDDAGKREIAEERASRDILAHINFAYRIFRSPEEVLYASKGDYAISIQQFIEQERAFLERPITEQFALAVKAFAAQEGAHMTTYGHQQLVERAFESAAASEYLARFAQFKTRILGHEHGPELSKRLERAEEFLITNQETIEQYSGSLTHTDFVPHNFRVVDGDIYLLDHSSLRFGNKYEGWARFLNFMALYNPELEFALVEYVRLNRTPEESLAIKLMRVYRLGEIISVYTERVERATGQQQQLDQERVHFWSDVLQAILDDSTVSLARLEKYKNIRDRLRSPEEKQRQEGLH